jgi:uncharacterized protein YwgA
MNRLKRGAIIVSLVEALRGEGSWCGETNIQKAAYFLKEVARVPLEYSFVLYKYGPYSFDLTEDLTALCADDVLKLKSPDPKYGPSYWPGRMAKFVRSQYPKTIAAYLPNVQFVAKKLGSKTVTDLERLATSLYVRRKIEDGSEQQWAKRMHELKPHILVKDAKVAIKEVDKIIDDAQRFAPT